MLRRVAEVLLDAVRDTDTVARLGGDEFALLLPDVAGPEVPVAVAERVLRVLGEGFPGALTTSASIGIAVSVDGAKGIEQLMSQADLAMYAAKQRGKSRFAVYEPSLGVAHHARLELAEDLGRALSTEDELHVAYQPVVDLHSGRVKGVEALARWRHPIDGELPPSTFIPLAEANGMVVPLGLRVLNEACRAAAGWRTGRPELADFTVSVNLSARQLESVTLLEDVDAALAASGLPAANLQLEVTETVLVEDAASAARVMHALKSRGVRLALDDFGTGYSSLRYLNQFPLDVIKIDRSFVSDVHHAGPRGLIVETVLNLAHGLGLTTIAEGIEQPEERDYLIGLGCQEGQGFLFARPQSAAALELLLAAEHALLNP
jgi:predicted signal transduction protein with EAL and GGDEF domain